MTSSKKKPKRKEKVRRQGRNEKHTKRKMVMIEETKDEENKCGDLEKAKIK